VRIELGETDEAINKGVAKNISISIDGVRLILPVKTKISELLVLVKEKGIPNIGLRTPEIVPVIESQPQIGLVSGEIEREDIVRCIRVLERAQGADVDIRLGGEYRVLGIKKIVSGGQTMVEHYEVIDDNAPIPRRVMVSPVEVVLQSKHVPGPKKVLVFEERTICGYCSEENVLTLNQEKNKYTGKCSKCQKEIEVERPAPANSKT
jgi:hypothetical protein